MNEPLLMFPGFKNSLALLHFALHFDCLTRYEQNVETYSKFIEKFSSHRKNITEFCQSQIVIVLTLIVWKSLFSTSLTKNLYCVAYENQYCSLINEFFPLQLFISRKLKTKVLKHIIYLNFTFTL